MESYNFSVKFHNLSVDISNFPVNIYNFSVEFHKFSVNIHNFLVIFHYFSVEFHNLLVDINDRITFLVCQEKYRGVQLNAPTKLKG